jgi:hypothetical protein
MRTGGKSLGVSCLGPDFLEVDPLAPPFVPFLPPVSGRGLGGIFKVVGAAFVVVFDDSASTVADLDIGIASCVTESSANVLRSF